MEAAVKTLRVMPNALRRPTTYVNSEPVRVLDEDAIFASMFDNETIDFNEILDFLRRKTTPTRILDDAFFIALTQDILDGKPPTISRKEVLQAIAFGSVSDEVVEDMEGLTRKSCGEGGEVRRKS